MIIQQFNKILQASENAQLGDCAGVCVIAAQCSLVVFCVLSAFCIFTKMEEVTPSQSDVEQPHPPVNHNRPFFYVQPPSQPYFMYPWQVDPFGQYSFPGSAFPFGRPYMAPYQYMQYPGYVVPHAPMQPTDYRRMSHFLPTAAPYDLRFRQQFYQMSTHRETSSTEAQTDSKDPVSKVTDNLNDLHVREKSVESNIGLLNPVIVRTNIMEKLSMQPAGRPETVGEGAESAMYDESSQGRLEETLLSDVLPLDSSSIHEETQEQDGQGKFDAAHCSNAAGSEANQDSGAHVCEILERSDLDKVTSVQSKQVKTLPSESLKVVQDLVDLTTDYDLPYQILHLPCDKNMTGVFPKEVYMNTSVLSPSAKRYPLDNEYQCNFYPHVIPERQSVLSPSLEELSSRDEVFSTDVEDDPGSTQVQINGDKLSETSGVPIASDLDRNDSCSTCANTCACCGASLPDEDETQETSDQDYGCDLDPGDSGDVLRTGSHQHYSQPSCGQQVARHKDRKVLEEKEMIRQAEDCGRGCGGQSHAKEDRIKGPKSAQARCYSEHYQREGPGPLQDQESWTSFKGHPRSRSSRPVNGLQEKGKPARRWPACKTFAQQRLRRNEYDDHDDAEYSFSQRGRGSLKRRGTRN